MTNLDYYTIKEVAEKKGLTKQAIWKQIKKYHPVRIGKMWLIPKHEVDRDD